MTSTKMVTITQTIIDYSYNSDFVTIAKFLVITVIFIQSKQALIISFHTNPIEKITLFGKYRRKNVLLPYPIHLTDDSSASRCNNALVVIVSDNTYYI